MSGNLEGLQPILSSLCYVQTATHTLMLHRNKKQGDYHQGKWNGLGGKFMPGESPEGCIIREVREESGLTIRAPELRGMITFPGFDGQNDWYVFVFVAREFSGTLIDSAEGTLSWIPKNEVLQLNLWEGDRVFLPWLERPGFFSARFIYRGAKFVEHAVRWYGI